MRIMDARLDSCSVQEDHLISVDLDLVVWLGPIIRSSEYKSEAGAVINVAQLGVKKNGSLFLETARKKYSADSAELFTQHCCSHVPLFQDGT